MCSVLEEDFMLEEKLAEQLETQICKKCQSTDATVILRKIDVYCKECFLAASTHKFRAMLGKYRVIKPNDKVLVVYRFGHPSSSLLHMIRSGMDLSQHKKLRFNSEYLFIDEYEDLSIEEHFNLLKKVKEHIISYDFNVYFTSLQAFVKSKEAKGYSFEEYVTLLEDKSNINSYKNLTNKQDVSEIFRRNLTCKIAKYLKCPVVLTPEISMDTTVGILTNVSLGRGSHISLNIGILDDRDPEVKIFTPLRLFEMMELEYYNSFNKLEVIQMNNNYSPYESVQNLMKKFVEDLQVNYPSTIKTVTRTGDKLKCIKIDHVCGMCKAPIEKPEGLSSIEATEFSKIISTAKIEDLDRFQLKTNTQIFCFACSKLQTLIEDSC